MHCNWGWKRREDFFLLFPCSPIKPVAMGWHNSLHEPPCIGVDPRERGQDRNWWSPFLGRFHRTRVEAAQMSGPDNKARHKLRDRAVPPGHLPPTRGARRVLGVPGSPDALLKPSEMPPTTRGTVGLSWVALPLWVLQERNEGWRFKQNPKQGRH